MRQNPFIMALFFGPVLWIGIALYEELIRIFILTELWKWKKARLWDFVVILLSAVLIGLVHWSQGPYGIVTIAIKGLISGIYFYKKRRIMPLVYAHVLYDGIQVAILLITYPDN
jgi:membrane protease YdiL (CAAX protease family)